MDIKKAVKQSEEHPEVDSIISKTLADTEEGLGTCTV